MTVGLTEPNEKTAVLACLNDEKMQVGEVFIKDTKTGSCITIPETSELFILQIGLKNTTTHLLANVPRRDLLRLLMTVGLTESNEKPADLADFYGVLPPRETPMSPKETSDFIDRMLENRIPSCAYHRTFEVPVTNLSEFVSAICDAEKILKKYEAENPSEIGKNAIAIIQKNTDYLNTIPFDARREYIEVWLTEKASIDNYYNPDFFKPILAQSLE
jgi:hypothetical protein